MKCAFKCPRTSMNQHESREKKRKKRGKKGREGSGGVKKDITAQDFAEGAYVQDAPFGAVVEPRQGVVEISISEIHNL